MIFLYDTSPIFISNNFLSHLSNHSIIFQFIWFFWLLDHPRLPRKVFESILGFFELYLHLNFEMKSGNLVSVSRGLHCQGFILLLLTFTLYEIEFVSYISYGYPIDLPDCCIAILWIEVGILRRFHCLVNWFWWGYSVIVLLIFIREFMIMKVVALFFIQVLLINGSI